MFKFILILLLLVTSSLFSLEIDQKTTLNELLSHSKIYKDMEKNETIKTIQNREFKPNTKTLIGCGYSPKYSVWIKFKLTNKSSDKIEKVIEYGNPLTSSVEFFEEGKLVKKDGLLNRSLDRDTINPIFRITLAPHQSKIFFIKASSDITTLIVKLNVWSIKEFQEKENQYKFIIYTFFILMLFFIIYNLLTILITKEISYLYFIIFFITVIFHHFVYKGIAPIYLPQEYIKIIIDCSSCIVALPIIFLALFVQSILQLNQYPKINKLFKSMLLLYPIIVTLILFTELYEYRNYFSMIVLVVLFIIAGYSLFKKNKNAPFVCTVLSLTLLSGILMHLSSLGSFEIFQKYPYYVEITWILIIIPFPLTILISKINRIDEEKRNAKKSESTLQEFKHRTKNYTQTILNILFFKKENIEDKKNKMLLTEIENIIMATDSLSSLLDVNKKIDNINEYFILITKKIKENFKQEHINVKIQVNIDKMNSEEIKYCSLIINEAMTNSFKYAFSDLKLDNQKIDIYLSEKKNSYSLKIKDNGQGFSKISKDKKGSGLNIIKKIAIYQLEGKFNIKKDKGVEIDIKWSKNERYD